MDLNSTQEIIDDIRLGKMVILMDDEDRENEGDLIIAAEKVCTEDINFMATNARGLICLTLTRERCEHLKLPLMVNENNTPYKPEDIVQPGHVFPIMAQPGGVLRRAGHTEAGCDLARLAGYQSAATIVEIMNEDGSMARRKDLELFAQKHGIKIGTIVDLIHYRIANEQTVARMESHMLMTKYGEFAVHRYQDSIS